MERSNLTACRETVCTRASVRDTRQHTCTSLACPKLLYRRQQTAAKSPLPGTREPVLISRRSQVCQQGEKVSNSHSRSTNPFLLGFVVVASIRKFRNGEGRGWLINGLEREKVVVTPPLSPAMSYTRVTSTGIRGAGNVAS